MRLTVRRALTIAAAMLGSAAGLRAQGGPSLLISAQELNTHLNDPSLVLLYVGPKESYDKEHIPGARFLDLREVIVSDPARRTAVHLPDEADLRARLERLGIGDHSLVVVVPGDDWGSPSTRLIWTLQAAGLGARSRLLNGGSVGWKAAGFATTAAVPPPAAPAHLTVAADRSITVDYQWVQAHTNAPHVKLIDARNTVFYEGPGMPEHNAPGGHIAGAKNLPFDELFDNSVTLLSTADLKKKFDAVGVAPGDTVAAYCHAGQQATMVLFAARLLGHPIRLYDGSMNDWQQRDLPLEGGTTAPKSP